MISFGLGAAERVLLRVIRLCGVLTLLSPLAVFAQDMTAKPMPEKVADNRQIIRLTEAEQALVAADMRQMLSSVHGVADGLAREDMQAVGNAASKSGMVMMQELPSQIRVKFPQAFAQMGMASHKAFDQIEQEARTDKKPAAVLKQLSTSLQMCVACHATYRFALPN